MDLPSGPEDAVHDDPPMLFGQEMGILDPRLGWYILHARVWKRKPAGMFQNRNPAVTCP